VGLLVEPLRVSLVKGESKPLAYRPVQASGDPADHLCVQFAIQTGGEKVAAVDSFGVVMASDTGHAVVQVTVPGRTFPPMHVAVEVRSDSVKWRYREISMVPGAVDTLQLVVPAQGNRPINSVGIFQFVSSDSTKVRVAPLTPIVTAQAAGSAHVIAQSSIYPDIPITVNVHRRVARIVGTPVDTLITLAIGALAPLTARPLAADSSPVVEVPVTWTVSDTTVARYDSVTKLLRGLKMGEVFVRVSAPVAGDTSIVMSWRVKVIAGGLAISRPGPKVVLDVGQRVPVEVKILDDRRQPVETATRLAWTSGDTSVARVADGQIVASGMGWTRLTARAPWDSTVATEAVVYGDLLFYGQRAGRWDVYMLDHAADGQQPRWLQLTQDTMIKSTPAWAPSLMRIAYAASPNLMGGSDLYLLDLDRTVPQALTHDSATARWPSFVPPGGDQIVFESSRTGKAQIYVIKQDGTGRRQVTTSDNPNTQPDVSPDGRRVLFTSLRERNYDIYEIGLDGTGERRLTTNPRPEDSPQYSADGRTFYYLRDEGGNPLTKRVYRQDLTTGVATPVTPVGVYVQAYSPSADDSLLALVLLSADANGVQTTKTAIFKVASGTMSTLVLPGFDRIAGPVFHPAAQH
jgi:hypothetical protein